MGSSKAKYNVVEDNETDIDSLKYLRRSYKQENFSSKIASLRKSNQKVVVIKDGREVHKDVFQRD